MVRLPLSSVFNNKDIFLHFVTIYNQTYRENTESKSHYVSLMNQYNEERQNKDLKRDDSYIKLAYITLESWNMNQRGAQLTTFTSFKNSIIENADHLNSLDMYRMELLNLEDINTKIFPALKYLFLNLGVMDTHARIVGVSKTLHFMLPNLVMPIDRENIINFLYLGGRYSSNPEIEFRYFTEIFNEYWKLCVKLSLSEKDVDHIGWNTSIPKMIDNAIIGFKRELLKGNLEFIFK